MKKDTLTFFAWLLVTIGLTVLLLYVSSDKKTGHTRKINAT